MDTLHEALRPFGRRYTGTAASAAFVVDAPSSSASARASTSTAQPGWGGHLGLDGEEEDEEDYELIDEESIEDEYGHRPGGNPSTSNHHGPDAEPASSSSSSTSPEMTKTTSYPPPETASASATPAPAQAPDQPLHDALSRELLRLSTVLRSNALAFSDALERDRRLLEKSSDQLGANLDFMTRTRGRLGEYSRRARGMGWFTLTSIAIVLVSWILCFILIRLT